MGNRAGYSNAVTQVGCWTFEKKLNGQQYFARKTASFGSAFSASAVITITANVPVIELLINKSDDTFTKQDFQSFKIFITENLGFKKVTFGRFKRGKQKEITKKV
jgi:hypothetical protein